MAKDLMRYDKLAQEALRGVVRQALARAASPEGLPGAHHFYVTFKTTDSRCDLDESLLKSYPDEMTIVLEHQFWDLSAEDDHFEVTLKFGGVPKYLRVPYTAVTRFHDPAVGFYLHFEYEPVDTPPGQDLSDSSDEDAPTVVSLDAFRKKD
nr:ClpXP protease specificity-enhancing factor SspB [Woodsholea maritima]